MIAVIHALAYLACGVCAVRLLLPRHTPLTRIWLGLSLGVLLMMWLPALCAFALGFTMGAHWLALGVLALLTGACFLLRDQRSARGWDGAEQTLLRQWLAVALPLTLLSAWLQYTHVIRVTDNGWYVGQSTYGDLPMHLSFITGLKNAPFPPEYPFYPGHRLSYPFLADSLSTSFYLMGWSLQAATAVPATLMMALCYMGFLCLARELTTGKKAAVLATLFFFLNGGLGFLYDFDQAAGYEADGSLTVLARLRAIMTGFYKTPTNQPEPNNLRWSNVIADLMVPQRTLLGGWCMLIPCLYLLATAFSAKRGEDRGGLRAELLLGVWGGALPLIHTHSFLSLGLCSLGWMAWDLLHSKGQRGAVCLRYLRYGALAVALALPQLICFTFTQTFQQAGSEGAGNTFLRFQFNWVNNPGGQGMRDFYLWFYIKNIGLPFAALVLALFEKDPRNRRLFAGALCIILAAELVRFQPNEYDNNKLFYPAWMLCSMIAANWLAALWRRLKGLRARPVMAAAAAVLCFLSPALTLARECVSEYQAFGPGAVEAAEYIREHTEEDSLFLTGTQHLNPVDSLAGRRIVCGPDLWLYYHGFRTAERKADIRDFYEDPETYRDVLDKYGADYVYVSSYERSDYAVDEDWLDANLTEVFRNWECTVYRVEEP